ncbi:hypothetical protein LTR49_026810, partial [Elasticomyces elasticus]
ERVAPKGKESAFPKGKEPAAPKRPKEKCVSAPPTSAVGVLDLTDGDDDNDDDPGFVDVAPALVPLEAEPNDVIDKTSMDDVEDVRTREWRPCRVVV